MHVSTDATRCTATRRWLARSVVSTLGGRYSTALGIDVDADADEVERWFLAATLFGNRITARIAERTFRTFGQAGLVRIEQARNINRADLVTLLDRGGYVRYDFSMAARLAELSEAIGSRYDGRAALVGERFTGYRELAAALDALPGWGQVTIQLFLRELRGVWPGAQPPLDQRAVRAARHLGLLDPPQDNGELRQLNEIAASGGIDPRDLETGLVRLDMLHRRQRGCSGGADCRLLIVPGSGRPGPGTRTTAALSARRQAAAGR